MNSTFTGDGSGSDKLLNKEKDNLEQLSEISKNSRTTFFALILACVYSYLAISTTTDAALLSNSGAIPLPIIQVDVPIVWFYLFAPIILTVLYVYFHLYLERFWRCMIRLPLYHPDGRGVDDYVYPWLISSTFIRSRRPELAGNGLLARFEFVLCVVLGWLLIPVVLIFYWARYLVAHDWPATMLHVGLILLTAGFGFRYYYLAKNAVLAIPANTKTGDVNEPPVGALQFKRRQIVTASVALLFLVAPLSYLSLSAIYGLPTDKCRSIAKSNCRYYIFGTKLLNVAGVQPFADVVEKKLVAKPENWQELLNEPDALRRYLDTQSSLTLSNRNLRHLNGQRAFLPASRLRETSLDYADLRDAVLTHSELTEVSFRGANLTHVDLQYSRIISTQFENVVADVSRFNHAWLMAGEKGKETRFSGDYYDAWFEQIHGDKLHFADANLRETHFLKAQIGYSTFQNVDLAGAKLDKAELANNKFYNTDFSSAQINGTDLSFSLFEECVFISTAITDALFEDAEIKKTRFDCAGAIRTSLAPEPNTAQSNAPRNVIDGLYGFGARIRHSEIKNTHFKNGELLFSTFENVTFSNTLFSDTDLSGATFIGTDFSGVEFENVDFSGADLKQVTGFSERHRQNICGNKETKPPPGFIIDPCIEKKQRK